MMCSLTPLRYFFACSLLYAFAVRAEEPSATQKQWREQLADNGVELAGVITSDLLGNVSGGGIKRGVRDAFNIDLTAALDTEKAGMWKGGRAFLYLLGDFGGNPSDIIGDAQVVSNIDAPTSFKVYEAWYEHAFLDGSLTFLGGLHDYNSEFDSLAYAGTLINSSFGVTPEIAQIGPSIFPTTALSFRTKVLPTEQTYVMFALFDGIPGDPNNPRGTHVILKHSDGIFYAAEVGFVSPEDVEDDYYKIAWGGWLHTTDYEDFREDSRSKNQGTYLIGEKQLYSEEDPEQGLGVFLQFGFADGSRNQFNRYYGGGFAYTGLIPSRDADVFSFGYASAQTGESYRAFADDALRSETSLEFTYRAPINSWLTIQPDFQYVVNPGAVTGIHDAKVVGVRMEVAF